MSSNMNFMPLTNIARLIYEEYFIKLNARFWVNISFSAYSLSVNYQLNPVWDKLEVLRGQTIFYINLLVYLFAFKLSFNEFLIKFNKANFIRS